MKQWNAACACTLLVFVSVGAGPAPTLPRGFGGTVVAEWLTGARTCGLAPEGGRLLIEQTAEKPSQDLHSLLGKIWRLNVDGSIPTDNPFYGQTSGKYRAIWCLGLRNPFCFAFQSESGRMFINDVGGAKEEIDEGKAGA